MVRVAARLRNARAVRALVTWRGAARAAAHNRAMLRVAAARLRMATAGKAFDTWHAQAGAWREQRAQMSRAAAFLRNRTAAAAFATWRDQAEDSARSRAVAARAASRLANWRVASGLDRWRSEVRARAGRRAAAAAVMARWRSARTVQALVTWRETAARRRHVRSVMDKAARRLRMRAASAAFGGWKASAEESRRRRDIADRFVRRARNARLAGAVGRWAEAAAERRSRRGLMMACARRFAMRAQGRAVRRWVEALDERKEARLAGRRALQWWRGAATRKCFSALASNREANLVVKDRMRDFVRRGRILAAAKAFEAWRANAGEARWHRGAMARAVARWQRRETTAAFARWRAFLVARARARLILRRMRVARQAAAWERWREQARRAEQARSLAEQAAARALSFWTNGTTARVFGAWRRHAERKRSLLDRGNAVAAARSRRLAVRAWRTWRVAGHVETLHRAALLRRCLATARAGAELQRAERRETADFDRRVDEAGPGAFALLRAAGLRWARLDAGRAFSSMALFARMRRVRRLRSLMARQHRHAVLAAGAWRRWALFVQLRRELHAAHDYHLETLRAKAFRGLVEGARRQRAERARFEVLEASADMHARLGAARRGFEAWASAYVHAKVARARAAERIFRSRTALQRDVLLAWHADAAASRRLRAAADAMMSRSAATATALRFRFWRDRAREARRHRGLADGFFARSASRRGLLQWQMRVRMARWARDSHAKAALLRQALTNRSVGQVFSEWRAHAAKCAAADRLRRRFLAGNLRPACFRSWRDWSRKERFQRSAAAQHVMKLLATRSRRCFEALRDHAAEERRVRAAMRAVVARWTQRRLTRGLVRWRQAAVTRTAAREAGRRAVRRMLRARAVRALAVWREEARGSAGRRERALVFLRRLRHAKAHGAIVRWAETAAAAAANRAAMRRAVVRMTRARTLQALVRWRETAAALAGRRAAATRVVLRMRNTRLAFGLQRWRDEVAERAAGREAMGRAVARMRSAGAVRALRRWAEAAAEASASRDAMMRAVLVMRNQRTAAAVRRWAQSARERAEHREAVRAAVSRWTSGLMTRAFGRLRDGCDAQREERERLRRREEHVTKMVRRRLAGAQEAVFGAWLDGFRWRRDARGKAERFLAIMQGRSTASTFYAWVDFGRAARAERRAGQHLARLLYGKAMARLKDHARVCRAARTAARRIRHGKLWRGLAAWRRFRVTRRFARMIRSREEDVKHSALRQWRSNAEFSRAFNAKRLRAAQTMVHGAKAHAFRTWRAGAQVARAVRALAGRTRGQELASRFGRWKRAAARGRRLRLAADHVRAGMGLASARGAWMTWRRAFVASRAGRAAVLRRAFASLRAVQQAAAAERHRGDVAAAVVFRGQIHRALLGWAAYSSRAREYRVELRREQMVRLHIARRQERARERLVALTFAVWRGRAGLARRCRGIARRFGVANVGRRCFAALATHAAGRRDALERARRAARIAHRSLLRRLVLRWRSGARARNVQRRALGMGAAVTARRAFVRWRQASSADAERRRATMPRAQRLRASAQRRRAVRLLRSWRRNAIATSLERGAPTRAASRLLRRWRRSAAAARTSRRKAARAAGFLRQRMLVATFASWKGQASTFYAPGARRDAQGRPYDDDGGYGDGGDDEDDYDDVTRLPRGGPAAGGGAGLSLSSLHRARAGAPSVRGGGGVDDGYSDAPSGVERSPAPRHGGSPPGGADGGFRDGWAGDDGTRMPGGGRASLAPSPSLEHRPYFARRADELTGHGAAAARRRSAEARARIDRARSSPVSPGLGAAGLLEAGPRAIRRFHDGESDAGSSRSRTSSGRGGGDAPRRGREGRSRPTLASASPGWVAPATAPATPDALGGASGDGHPGRALRGLSPGSHAPGSRLASAPAPSVDLDELGRSLGMNIAGAAASRRRAVQDAMARSVVGSSGASSAAASRGRHQGLDGRPSRGSLRVSDLGRHGDGTSALASGVRALARRQL